jgi:hypothetical protein
VFHGQAPGSTKLEAKKSRLKKGEKMNERNERVGGHRPHGEERKDVYLES